MERILIAPRQDGAPASEDAPNRLGYEGVKVEISAKEAADKADLAKRRRVYKAACAMRRDLSKSSGKIDLAKNAAAFSEKEDVPYSYMDILEAMPDRDLKKKWDNPELKKLCKRYRDEACFAKFGEGCFINPDCDGADKEAVDVDEAEGEIPVGKWRKFCK